MDALNYILNNIQVVQPQATTSKSSSGNTSVSFKGILDNALSVSTTGNENVESGITDIKTLVSKIINALKSNDFQSQISDLLKGMTKEQLNTVSQILDKLSLFISQAITSGNLSDSQNMPQLSTSDDDKQDDSIESVAMQQLQALFNALYSGAEIIKVPETDSSTNAQTQTTAQQSTEEITAATPMTTLTVTPQEIAVTSTAVTPQAQESGNEKTDTDKNVKEGSFNVTQEVTTVSGNNVSSQVSELVDRIQKFVQIVNEKLGGNSTAENSQTSDAANSGVKFSDVTTAKGTTSETAQNNSISDTFAKISSEINQTSKIVKQDESKNSELSELTAAATQSKQVQPQTVVPDVEKTGTSVENQIQTFLKSDVLPQIKSGETTEMTMTLNPEELGKISIKITKTGADITVAIAAQNSMTSKLIEDKLPTLISNLKTNDTANVDVRVVTPNQNTSQFMNHAGLGQQTNGQQSSEQRRYSSQASETVNDASQSNTDLPDFLKEAKLWQTA